MKGKRFLVAGILIVLLAVAGAFAAPFRIAVVMPSATTDMAFSQSMWDALRPSRRRWAASPLSC